MLEEILFQIASLVPGPGVEFGTMDPGSYVLAIVSCVVGAIILGRFTGSIGGLTLPINFSALFIGAVTADWLLHGLDLPIDHGIEQPLLVILIGMTLGALSMLIWFQEERRHA